MSFQHISIELLQKILSLSDLDQCFQLLLKQVNDDLGAISSHKMDIFEPGQEISAYLSVLSPAAREAFAHRKVIACAQARGLVCLPMISTKKNILGVVSIQFSQNLILSQEKQSYLETITSLISTVVERKQSTRDTKRILKELQSSQERLSLALLAQKMGVWDWDIASGHLLWDKTMFEIFGVAPKDFTYSYESFQNCLIPEDLENTNLTVQAVLNNQFDYDITFRINRFGEIRYISAAGSVIRDEFGKPVRFTGLNWDVTDKVLANKKLEQERGKTVANSKMASLGEMASGIAHEINNPLTIILNRTCQLKSSLLKSDLDKKVIFNEIEKIESTFQRIVKIIRGLKAFSRNADNDPMISCNLNSIIDETLELCLEKFKTHGVSVRLSGLEHLYYLSCRPSQISQVLLNLLNNSFDAVSTTNNPWIEIKVSLHNTSLATYVQIHVTDSGKGIPLGIADKMMDPFFTTKDVGQGTGLGLPISKGLIEQHKGKLWLDKESEHTTFIVQLPLEELVPRSQFPSAQVDLQESGLQ